MRIFGFFSLIVWFLVFVVLAIMFDWFGARDMSKTTLKYAEAGIEFLEATGDTAMRFIDEVSGEKSDDGFKMPELPQMPKE